MTLVLPDTLAAMTRAAGQLAAFLERSGFPDARAAADLREVSTPEGLVAVHDRRREKRGMVDLLDEMIREVHSSEAFDAHVRGEAVRGAGLRVPRLRALLPGRPETAAWRVETVAALARSLRAAQDADARAALLRLWLAGPAFAELTDPKGGRAEMIAALFKAHPTEGLALLEAPEALEGLGGALGALLLAGCGYFAANRSFARCHALAADYLARLGPRTPEAGDAFDHLWYAAFRLGRLEEAEAALRDWSAAQPMLKRPLVYRAIVASVSDPDEALSLLELAGAELGRASVGGNVLHAEALLRRGEARRAERALRHALHEDAPRGTSAQRVRPDYAVALHNATLAQGRPSQALAAVFERHGLDLRWEGAPGLDTVEDHSRAPGATGRVAVIMTAWNAEAHLERAMRGVLEQSHADLELIVMDDCSQDGTGAVAARLAEADPRVSVRRTPRNLGTYAAKNLGIRLALERGAPFVTLCDSDDWWLRAHLAYHLEAMEAAPEAVCSTSQWVRMRDDGSIEAGLRGRYVETCPHSTFLRREAFERAGFFDAVRFGADREFLNRVSLHFGAEAVAAIPRILTLGRRHDASLTTSGAGAISEFNESPIRLDYWRAWNDWQLSELEAGRAPVLDGDPDAPRPFAVDPAMVP